VVYESAFVGRQIKRSRSWTSVSCPKSIVAVVYACPTVEAINHRRLMRGLPDQRGLEVCLIGPGGVSPREGHRDTTGTLGQVMRHA